MTVPGVEKAYEKYAWILLFVAGLFPALIQGPLLIINGYTAQCGCTMPASTPTVAIDKLNDLAQATGSVYVFTGVLMAAIAWTGYRRGQRWSWYFMLWALGFYYLAGRPVAGTPGILILVLSVPGLVLPYRKFFPRKAPVSK